MSDKPNLKHNYGTINKEYGIDLATRAPENDGPIYMVNLMKYHEVAQYQSDDGMDKSISGREADDRYNPSSVVSKIGADIDFVADVSCPTPSLAAQYIVDHNMKYVEKLNQICNRSKQVIVNMINKTSDNMMRWKYEIKSKLDTLDYSVYRSKSYVESFIQNKINELESIKDKYKMDKITIISNNKIIDSSNSFQDIINKKQSFTIVWDNVKLDVNL